MSERRTKMVAYLVDITCGKCGGDMVADGVTLTVNPPLYPHTCVDCGKKSNLSQCSGSVVYEPEEAGDAAD